MANSKTPKTNVIFNIDLYTNDARLVCWLNENNTLFFTLEYKNGEKNIAPDEVQALLTLRDAMRIRQPGSDVSAAS